MQILLIYGDEKRRGKNLQDQFSCLQYIRVQLQSLIAVALIDSEIQELIQTDRQYRQVDMTMLIRLLTLIEYICYLWSLPHLLWPVSYNIPCHKVKVAFYPIEVLFLQMTLGNIRPNSHRTKLRNIQSFFPRLSLKSMMNL